MCEKNGNTDEDVAGEFRSRVFYNRIMQFLRQQGLNPVSWGEWVEIYETAKSGVKVVAIRMLREKSQATHSYTSKLPRLFNEESKFYDFVEEHARDYQSLTLDLLDAKQIVDLLLFNESIFDQKWNRDVKENPAADPDYDPIEEP